MKTLITILILLALGLGAYLMYREPDMREPSNTQPDAQQDENPPRAMSVEDYVTANISTLSAGSNAPEVLGGTFYVTEVEAEDGKGVVQYEDGHNAYTADFTYVTDSRGAITINTFKVRK